MKWIRRREFHWPPCGMDKLFAAHEAAVLRLRPVLMTALVAALGLLPAAVARDGDRLQV